MIRSISWLMAGVVGLFTATLPVSACSVCFGDPESPLTKGVGWGIISLLSVVMVVLGAISGFFIYLAKRTPAVPSEMNTAQSSSETINKA